MLVNDHTSHQPQASGLFLKHLQNHDNYLHFHLKHLENLTHAEATSSASENKTSAPSCPLGSFTSASSLQRISNHPQMQPHSHSNEGKHTKSSTSVWKGPTTRSC